MRAYCSPSRFAVCCVLLRQIVPRHSPYALSSLTTCELYLSIFFLFSRICLVFYSKIFISTFWKDLSFLFSSNFSLYRFVIFSFQCSYFFECLTLKTKQYRLIRNLCFAFKFLLLRKEVIHPHVPVGIPCYDFTPIIDPTFDSSLHFWLGHRLRVLSTLMVWRAVCTRPENVFTAIWLTCDY